MSCTEAKFEISQLRKLVEESGPLLSGPASKGIKALLEYEKTLDQLAWYIGARGVNPEESAMAAQSVIKEFLKAEE